MKTYSGTFKVATNVTFLVAMINYLSFEKIKVESLALIYHFRGFSAKLLALYFKHNIMILTACGSGGCSFHEGQETQRNC